MVITIATLVLIVNIMIIVIIVAIIKIILIAINIDFNIKYDHNNYIGFDNKNNYNNNRF